MQTKKTNQKKLALLVKKFSIYFVRFLCSFKENEQRINFLFLLLTKKKNYDKIFLLLGCRQAVRQRTL
ncbi:hypothetical protein RFZ33_11365, partial [Acinetobacter baumannii]|nr:hypothetical protein [Acinetobacter baumannii]